MPRFLRVLTANWQLKLLAFALAVLLWVVVSAEQVTSTWIPVPMMVEVTDPNYQLLRESVPEQVRVRFVGPGREFFDVAVRRPPLMLRIDEVDRTEQVFGLDPSMVRLPSGLEVSARDVDPNFLRLRFQQLSTRLVPVRIQVARGNDRRWTFVDSLEVVPDHVRVSGLAERIGRMAGIATVPISVPASEGEFDRMIPLDTVGLGEVHASLRRVRVIGRVERVVDREFAGLSISHGAGVHVSPTRVNVRVRGVRTAIDRLQPGDLRVGLALDSLPAQLPPQGVLVPLRVGSLPTGISLTGLTPASVILLPVGQTPDSAATPLEEAGDAPSTEAPAP